MSESGQLRKASHALQRRELWLVSGEAEVPELTTPLPGEKPIRKKKWLSLLLRTDFPSKEQVWPMFWPPDMKS